MMKTSETVTEFFKALAKFQSEVDSPKKSNENPAFKREGKAMKYADLDAVIKAVTPALTNNGLSQMQFTSSNIADQTVSITTLLTHTSGEFIQSEPLIVPAENFGKFNAQTIGSAITYGRRYALSAILGIASEDDDDANTQSLPDEKPNKSASNNNRGGQRKPTETKKDTRPPEEKGAPIASVDELNKRMTDAFSGIEALGGDKKQVQRLYLETMGLPNFDSFNKSDFVAFLEDVHADMRNKNDAQQGELLKNGTTTANNNVIGWGTK